MAGTLYLCATPIGNLEDMSMRAIRILKEADLIAAEDTRNSMKLLNHFEIKTKMTSYHEYNKVEKAHFLINKLQEGLDIALITDAGTPGISDPGEEVVKRCLEQGITVTSVPGACAAVNALILSGLPTRRFVFEGFIPGETKEKRKVMDRIREETRTIILYEAPHHLKKTLQLLHEELGDRQICLCREMTKRYEDIHRGSLSEIIAFYEKEDPRGEYVLILAGKDPEDILRESQERWENVSLADHMNHYEQMGFDRKEAMKKVAKDRGVKKRDIYQRLLNDEE